MKQNKETALTYFLRKYDPENPRALLALAEECLNIERDQIIEAWQDGHTLAHRTGTEYYTTNYNYETQDSSTVPN